MSTSNIQAPALQCRHLVTIARRATADLTDAHLALEPRPGLKTSGWLLGHLATTGDFGRRLCGRKDAICPRDWRDRFAPGSRPATDPSTYPPMRELREAMLRVYEDLAAAAEDADEATLGRDNPYEPTRGRFPLASDFAGYLLAGHFGYHLGQLSAWRAAAGLSVLGQGD